MKSGLSSFKPWTGRNNRDWVGRTLPTFVRWEERVEVPDGVTRVVKKGQKGVSLFPHLFSQDTRPVLSLQLQRRSPKRIPDKRGRPDWDTSIWGMFEVLITRVSSLVDRCWGLSSLLLSPFLLESWVGAYNTKKRGGRHYLVIKGRPSTS